MSLLIKTLKQKHIFEAYRALSTAQVRHGHFFPDFKPGPVPKTEEERLRAAKKYNLLPEEYECYPEGSGYGDYPKVPFESVDSKDPWYPWDNEELRRNFNEPPNVQIINLFPECLSTDKPEIPHWKGFLFFLGLVACGVGFTKFLELYETALPVAAKQIVTPGVTHYTFDPDYCLSKEAIMPPVQH